MGSSKPKPVQAPFKQDTQQQQQQTNTYGGFSVSDSPEAKDFYALPINFGESYGGLDTNIDVDPGVGRRTDLAEQEEMNRANSAFSGGVPSWIRQGNLARNLREIRGQGAAEAQQAKYAQQRGQRDLEFQKAQLVEGAGERRTQMELARRERLLPQILQTGGSSSGTGSSSGFNTQIVQPQPGFWQRAALGAIQGASGAATGRLFG